MLTKINEENDKQRNKKRARRVAFQDQEEPQAEEVETENEWLLEGGRAVQEEQRNSNRNRDKSIRAITFKSNTTTQDPIQDPLDVPPSGMFAPLPPGDMNDEAITASEEQHQEIVRRMHTDDVPPTNTPILIMDNAADISCIGRGFEILFYTGETMTVSGAMAEMQSIEYEIVTSSTVVETPLSTQS